MGCLPNLGKKPQNLTYLFLPVLDGLGYIFQYVADGLFRNWRTKLLCGVCYETSGPATIKVDLCFFEQNRQNEEIRVFRVNPWYLFH